MTHLERAETRSRFNSRYPSASDMARKAKGRGRQTALRPDTLALAQSSISYDIIGARNAWRGSVQSRRLWPRLGGAGFSETWSLGSSASLVHSRVFLERLNASLWEDPHQVDGVAVQIKGREAEHGAHTFVAATATTAYSCFQLDFFNGREDATGYRAPH